MKKLFVSACEPSANIHLKEVAYYLPKDLQIIGIFESSVFSDFPNAKMIFSLEDFAVMGIFDVAKKYSFFKNAINKSIEIANECDCALFLDSSSFHLPIAKGLKKINSPCKIIYYILPQVWAWKQWRAKEISRICDRLCSTLPFESSFYEKFGANITFVGHPLLDEIKNIDSTNLKIAESKKQIALMPGSRKGEIKRIFPIFANAARKIKAKKVLVIPKHFQSLEKKALQEIYIQNLSEFELSFDANETLAKSSFAFICSGTATLQSALIGTPFVLAYKARMLEYALVRPFVPIKKIGLANILFNALKTNNPKNATYEIHRELIQGNLSVKNLIDSYENFDKAAFEKNCQQIREYLKCGSAKNVSDIVLEALNLA